MLKPSINDGLGEVPQTRKSRRPDADATGRTVASEDEDDPDDTDGNDSDSDIPDITEFENLFINKSNIIYLFSI